MKKMKEIKEIVNLTPHKIILKVDGIIIEVSPSGELARVTEKVVKKEPLLYHNRIIPIIVKEFGEVTGVPEPKEGTIYIVSRLVKNALLNREDIFSVGETTRDSEGRINGAKSLAL